MQNTTYPSDLEKIYLKNKTDEYQNLYDTEV